MTLPGYSKATLTDLPTANINAGTNYFVVSEQRWYYYNGSAWTKHIENLTPNQIQGFIDTQTQLNGFITTSENTVSTQNTRLDTLQSEISTFSGSINGTLSNFESRIVSVENNSNSGGGSNNTTDYTELLLKFNGENNSTDLVDDSKNNYLIVPNGNPIISTDQSKFGGSSLYLNNSLLKVSLDNFKGDFTTEFWFNSDDINNQTLVTKRNTYTNYGSFVLTFRNGVLNLLCTSNNSAWDISSDFKPLTSTLSTNTWYHFALVRERKNWYSYLDGVKITEFSNSELIMPNSYPLLIGGELDGYKYHGYFDNFRISLKALYTPTLYPNGFNVPDENFNVSAIIPSSGT